MSATILDGKAVAATQREQAMAKAAELQAQHHITPTLALVRVGQDEALLSQARSVQRSFSKAGFGLQEYELTATTPMADVLALVQQLNQDAEVHGIVIQEPLPAQIDQSKLLEALNPLKDVDGVTPINAGRLSQQRGHYHIPATPAGGMAILDAYKIPIQGQRAVVVGRSDIVGKPMALLLLHRHATVTIAHSRTTDLPALCREADILCAAVGRANLITADMVKPGATVIDFGINYVADKLVGDVAFEGVAAVAGAITPVPGGTGPVTSAIMLHNTLQAATYLLQSEG